MRPTKVALHSARSRLGDVEANVRSLGDTPEELSARIVVDGQTVASAEFVPNAENGWTISLPAPPTGDFELVVKVGEATATRLVSRTVEALEFPPLFNASQETAWAMGDVVEVERTTPEAAAPNFAAVFEDVVLDPILGAKPRVAQSGGIPGPDVGNCLAAALVALAVVFLRRRP